VFLLNILSPLMDDSLFVRRLQGVRDLFRDREGLVETFTISGNRVGEDLDGNVAPQLRVARGGDLAPLAPSGAKNFTRAEA